ncbi:hypothetical protein FJZ36_06800, partial [Candidatus Poribacteria bacterium]|nr:hypothetical protein [Candidatus Poribacteria bacterium]
VGLLQLSADAIALYGVETGLPSARIRAVAVAPDGRVWAGSDGTRGGLAIPEGETFRTLRAANGIGESNEVYSIAFDSRGRAWVGTGILRDPPDDVDILGGVARFDGATWRYWRTGSTPVAIAEDVRGTVWIGTKRRGLLRLDGDEFIEEPLPVGSEVRAILADGRGWLWVGTSDGLFARVGGEWREYSRADGLPGNSVRALIEDSTDGTVWAALDEGIAHWDPIRQWSQFTAADGVPSTGVLSVAQSVNGDLWFSGIGDSGLLRHRASTSLPQTRLLEAPRGIIGETATRISFTGGDVTTPPDQIRYAIRLDGGAWSAPQAEPSVFLSGLAPGRPILFEVAAVNRDGMADPTPARTVFYADVSPPYAEIAFPSGGSHVAGVVQLRGRAYDETDFEGYMVRIPGANPVQSDRAVRDGVLAEWDTRNVEDGEYELSLAVWDRLDGPNDVRHERSRVLSLVVDNTIPVVTLEPMVSPVSGRVLVRAELVDANLSSYRVEYRTSADGAWRNIEAGDLPLGAGGRASIAASWDTTPLDASVEVRVVAHDLAGNAGQASQGLAASNPGARPIVQVSAPASDSVLSGVVRVVGTASDETLVGFVVEARRSASEPWAGVGFGSAAVTGGVLSEWDTTRVADGTYELRVRAIDDAGYETIAPVPPLVIRIDNTPPILVSFPLPSPAQLYSGRGTIPIEAVIRDDSPITFRFEYSTSLTPSASDWLPAASGSATSDGRASTFWTVPTLDGDVLLRLLATDAAGHEMAPQVRQVSLDAALPRAQIISPEGGGIVTGVVTVVGTASDSHFAEYRLLYATPDGVDHPISARTSGDGVTQGVLGQWNTEGSEGPVSLRLRVRDAVGLESEAVVALAVDRSRPTASLRSPVSGSQVSGIVTMAGTATDRHFASYRIDWRLADGETWNPVTDSVSTAVIDGRLASWDTTGITGKAIVRLTATDVVGQSATSIAAVDVVAPVAADAGARLVSADGVVALRVPPKSLSSSIAITINPAPVASGNALMVYTLSPVDASLDSRKPAMLEFHLPPDAPLDSAIARWNAVTQEWQWLGGTVSGGAVRASISSFGTYAVLNGGRTPPISGDDALRLRSQPRAFSPSGGNLPGSTVVSFRLAKESPTRIRIYHGNGRLVRRLLDSDLRPGEHAIDWDGKDDDGDVVPNGIYVVYVGTRFAEATRLVLVWAP